MSQKTEAQILTDLTELHRLVGAIEEKMRHNKNAWLTTEERVVTLERRMDAIETVLRLCPPHTPAPAKERCYCGVWPSGHDLGAGLCKQTTPAPAPAWLGQEEAMGDIKPAPAEEGLRGLSQSNIFQPAPPTDKRNAAKVRADVIAALAPEKEE